MSRGCRRVALDQGEDGQGRTRNAGPTPQGTQKKREGEARQPVRGAVVAVEKKGGGGVRGGCGGKKIVIREWSLQVVRA